MPTFKIDPRKLTEEQEQEKFVIWLQEMKYKFSALPLSTYTKSWAVKMRNKRQGVRPGVPDLMIIVENFLVFIEMKRGDGGVISNFQKDWIEKLNSCTGVKAFVCAGAEEAKRKIRSIKFEQYVAL